MYQHILVPIDASTTAERGLTEAIELARSSGGRLRLLHALTDPVYATDVSGFVAAQVDLIPMLRSAGLELLARAEQRAASAGVAVESQQIELLGQRLCDVVAEDARRWGADLIVLGTHARHGIERFLLGSDAEQIMRLAPTPVLLVHADLENVAEKAAPSASPAMSA